MLKNILNLQGVVVLTEAQQKVLMEDVILHVHKAHVRATHNVLVRIVQIQVVKIQMVQTRLLELSMESIVIKGS